VTVVDGSDDECSTTDKPCSCSTEECKKACGDKGGKCITAIIRCAIHGVDNCTVCVCHGSTDPPKTGDQTRATRIV